MTSYFNIEPNLFQTYLNTCKNYKEILTKLGANPNSSYHRRLLKKKMEDGYNLSTFITHYNRHTKSALNNLSDEQFKKIVDSSKSKKDVIIKCGENIPHPTHYTIINNRIRSLDLSTSHFNQESIKSLTKAKNLSDIMVENSEYKTDRLKKRLLKAGILKNECNLCGLGPIWNKKPIVLQLDHINGVSNDHRLSNLRILCPNCHSQTNTYSGKNCKKEKKTHICLECENPISRKGSRCKSCEQKLRKKFKITESELKKLIENRVPYVKIANMYNVSDTTVKKYCKKYNLV